MSKTHDVIGQLVEYDHPEEPSYIILGIKNVGGGQVHPLAEIVSYLIPCGATVSLRWLLTESPVSVGDFERTVVQILYGAIEVDYGDKYSEVTGYLWTDQTLKLGGHDLIDELCDSLGKYLYMRIDVHEGRDQ